MFSMLRKQRCRSTAQLICVFVFAYACCLFSHAAAYITLVKVHIQSSIRCLYSRSSLSNENDHHYFLTIGLNVHVWL